MTKTPLNRFIFSLSLSIACLQAGYSQFTLVPISTAEHSKKSAISGRTQELGPMPLPFWDDFSFSNSESFPHDTLWLYGRSVWVNEGLGINPPSLGVATFDGLDSLGTPYDVNDVLAKGIADRLISRPLSMDLVDPGDRNSVYLSFYYQFRGNGEPPDPGDQLRVLLKNADDVWVNVLTIENDGSFDPTKFTQVLIPISNEQYFHEDFQFLIQSFGRLSGPYDTWNIDYVYLNSGRSITDTSYPDRTITILLTSMFDEYFSMPFVHFIEDPATNLNEPLLSVHNLEFIPGNTDQSDVQPLNYDSEDSVISYRDNMETIFQHTLDNATSIGNSLQPLEFRQISIQTLPVVSDLNAVDSAASIKLKLWINSGDNVTPSMSDPFGDYDPVKYAPIDFRSNDTTQIEFTLADYYAYDDGNAEYGAALNQPGAQLAYLFEMKTSKPDTIVALDLYFPRFGEDVSQSIEIRILRNLSGNPGSVIHRETVSVQRNSQNEFWRLTLNRFVGVQGEFYIGWKQSSASVLAIGLDKNTNSSNNIFFNINGLWEQNTTLTGSLMIRPVFGKGDGIITGLTETNSSPIQFYPNPSNGSFMISGEVDQIQVYDLTGRPVLFNMTSELNEKKVVLSSVPKGIYILRLLSDGTATSHRIMVE